MFYDKPIEILGKTEGYLDDAGIWHPGQEEGIKKRLMVDVQPYSKELAYRDYGFTEEVTYRIFSDVDNLIQVGTKISYRGKRFIINKVIDWDDHLEWMVKDNV